MSEPQRETIAASRRWVIKVGSALLTNDGRGLDAAMIGSLVAQIATLRADGAEVVLVSSGAVAAGRPDEPRRGYASLQFPGCRYFKDKGR